MKKVWKILLIVAALVVVITLMLIPGKEVHLDDGGSHFRKSFLRMEAEWFYMTTSGSQTVSRVYWFPETLKTAGQLKDEAAAYKKPQFVATILEINGDTVLVELNESAVVQYSTDKITFSKAELEDIGVDVGSRVSVIFDGEIMETYPGQIKPISWSKINKPD